MNPQQLQKMMKQAQKLQNEMQGAQVELEKKEYENTAGGGAVKVVMTGSKKIVNLEINEELLDKDEKEMLQDLIVSLINTTIDTIDKEAEAVMGQYTKGLPF